MNVYQFSHIEMYTGLCSCHVPHHIEIMCNIQTMSTYLSTTTVNPDGGKYRFICKVGIPILVRHRFYIESAPNV